MSSRSLIILVGIAAILVLGYLIMGQNILNNQAAVPIPSPEVQVSPVDESQTKGEFVITIAPNGFSPQTITIKTGETVTWRNSDSAPHQVSSSPHPAHTDYQPLNTVGMVSPGEEKSLSFPETGTYRYHDHLNPQNFGSVIVQ